MPRRGIIPLVECYLVEEYHSRVMERIDLNHPVSMDCESDLLEPKAFE